MGGWFHKEITLSPIENKCKKFIFLILCYYGKQYISNEGYFTVTIHHFVRLFIYLGFYVAFNTVQYIQYIQFIRVLYCKLPTNGKQLPAFPLEAMPGTELRPQRWEARVLPLCHRGPHHFVWFQELNKFIFKEKMWKLVLDTVAPINIKPESLTCNLSAISAWILHNIHGRSAVRIPF